MVDADSEAKAIMRTDTSLHKKLVESFGESAIIGSDSAFSSLGKVVFSSMPKLRTLNSIVHPLLLERLKKLVFSRDADCVICDAALITLWHIEEWFDVLMWVSSPFEMRRARLLQKGNLTNEETTTRMHTQQALVPDPDPSAWTIIPNAGPIEELKKTVQSLRASISFKE
jgi:dephospho-CoA kinase